MRMAWPRRVATVQWLTIKVKNRSRRRLIKLREGKRERERVQKKTREPGSHQSIALLKRSDWQNKEALMRIIQCGDPMDFVRMGWFERLKIRAWCRECETWLSKKGPPLRWQSVLLCTMKISVSLRSHWVVSCKITMLCILTLQLISDSKIWSLS